MKKTLLPFIIIIILIISGSIYWLKKQNITKEETPTEDTYTKEEKEKLAKLDNINEKIDYFNMDYLSRYLTYQQKNPNLKIEDIITRVNIGLDQPYYTNVKMAPYLNQIYILSNKYLALGENYVPDNLETLSSECARSGMQLVHEAKEKFEELCLAAKKDGYTIRAMSSYRDYNYQLNLYNRYVKQDGKEAADTYSARAGHSEHQTGLVVDVDNNQIDYTLFEQTKEYKWMQENAYKYGFIMRYPKDKDNITGYEYESWHYRYVGKEIATYIKNNNITFDEYYVRFIENKK